MRTGWEVRVLKGLLFVYILLAIVVAGFNFGWAPNASEKTQAAILAVWRFYENEFKTALIVTCSILTLRVVGKKEIPRMRRYNLIGLISAALAPGPRWRSGQAGSGLARDDAVHGHGSRVRQ